MKATRSFAGASAGRRICKNNWISFHANVISRRQLHNPMFPQRALPEINETKVKQGESDDFLSKHGGKVFATCMAAVFGLLYTYIKSNSMRSDLEDALSDERIVEPFETNAARARNQKFKKEVFDDIIASCYSHFPEKECTYSEFVSFVKQILFSKYGVVIADAHLLDRTIQAKCLKLALTEQNPQLSLLSSIDYNKNDEGILSAAHSKALTLLANHKFPLHYLLIVLSTVVRERAGLRVESLFSIAKYSDDWRGDSMDDSMADGCSSSAVLEVVTDLCETWQVPSDKKVVETGVNYLFKTFRVKSPEEMIDSYKGDKTTVNPPTNAYGKDDFIRLLFSQHICAWGECHPVPKSQPASG